MSESLTLYHGSTVIVDLPLLCEHYPLCGDFGSGLYCTKHYDVACEYASKIKSLQGYVNAYELDMTDLKILDLDDKRYDVLNWLAVMLKNRLYALNNPITIQAHDYILKNYSVDTSGYDIIKGHRGDCSRFTFTEDFIKNSICIEHLEKVLSFDKQATQYALVSKKAFEQLRFVKAEPVDSQMYYVRYTARDLNLMDTYRNKIKCENNIYVADIIRQSSTNTQAKT